MVPESKVRDRLNWRWLVLVRDDMRTNKLCIQNANDYKVDGIQNDSRPRLEQHNTRTHVRTHVYTLIEEEDKNTNWIPNTS